MFRDGLFQSSRWLGQRSAVIGSAFPSCMVTSLVRPHSWAKPLTRFDWSGRRHITSGSGTLTPYPLCRSLPNILWGREKETKEKTKKKGNQPLQIGPVKPWRPENTYKQQSWPIIIIPGNHKVGNIPSLWSSICLYNSFHSPT